jgi:hypothetical protein
LDPAEHPGTQAALPASLKVIGDLFDLQATMASDSTAHTATTADDFNSPSAASLATARRSPDPAQEKCISN